jgi:hypothetical protein
MKVLATTLVDRWFAAWTYVGQLRPGRVLSGRRYDAAHVPDELAAQSDATKTAEWCLASFLIVAGPILIASALLALLCGGGLWDCAPIWHDEMWYFNEMSVFEAAGWEGGYTVSHEWPARADWVRFGTHGPFVPALYGTLARATGLHVASIPLFNAGLLLAGGLIWVLCCRVDVRQAWVAAFVVATYWPLILYIPTSMQEVLHLSIAFVLAALSVLLVRHSGNRWLLLLALMAVAAAAQLRVTWAWVAVPLLWVAMRPETKRQWALLATCGLIFVAALYVEAVMLVSPYPNFMKNILAGAFKSPLATCWLVFVHTLKNIVRYIAPNHDTVVQIAFRWQTMWIVGAGIYCLRQRPLRAAGPVAATASGEQPDAASTAFGFTLVNLGCIGGFVIALYDVHDWRDFRVIAPHMLLSLLVLIACGSLDWLRRYAIIGLIAGVFAVVQFDKFHQPRVEFEPSKIAPFAEQASKVMPFEPGAPAWDNTMLIDMHLINSQELLGMPPGIGISTVEFWELQAWPPRSKYVLLTDAQAARLGIPDTMHKVAETGLGNIYVQSSRRPVSQREIESHGSPPSLVR